jgi:hypothetical protein
VAANGGRGPGHRLQEMPKLRGSGSLQLDALATWRILDKMRQVAASFEAMLQILATTYRVGNSGKTPMLLLSLP